jgi:N-acetylmuramoyl-L-alanine amidase
MEEKIIGTLDPGHGGTNNQNVGYSHKYYEHIGVLTISLDLKQELESTGAFKIFLTRDKDMTLDLRERAEIAVKNKSNFFISEHTNAGAVTAGGTEVFYSVDLPKTKDFAAALSANVSSFLGIKNRGAKTRESLNYPGEDYYGVIDGAQDGGIPNVFIIESAFHSNPDEEKKLLNRETLRGIAKAQAKAICAHYGVQYPPVAPPVINQEILAIQRNLNKLKIASLKETGIGDATTQPQ